MELLCQVTLSAVSTVLAEVVVTWWRGMLLRRRHGIG